MENLYHTHLMLRDVLGLGDDEHGADTPKRFVAMLEELTQCKSDSDEHVKDCIKWKAFPSESDEMVIVRDIPFVSLCNHHVLPFIGYAHVGYVPGEKNAGLSKFSRVVKHFARRLQVQERMTTQVASFLTDALKPKGLAVVIEAEHLCMTIRGVQSPGTRTSTQKMLGVFADHSKTAKMEFLNRINGGHK